MLVVRMLQTGEQGLVVEFGSEIDPVINARVHRLAWLLRREMPQQILELVPTYRSLTIYFDPLSIARQSLHEAVSRLVDGLESSPDSSESRTLISVPVSYGGEFGPDLGFIARHSSHSEAEVVALHTSARYRVYMLGFTPGFPYLGLLPQRIAAPRLDVPRGKVPAGSVGIAGNQTGIYPMESPGGWRLIGRTPLRLFDPRSQRTFLFAAGDDVQFVAIQPNEYRAIQAQVEQGSYSPRIETVAGDDRVHGD